MAVEGVFAAIEALPPVEALRFSRWSYAAANAGHVLGVALLVGGALPLSLRLLGFWPGVARQGLTRILAGTAGTGLALAVFTGLLLFATRATEYAAHPLLPFKLAFIAAGATSAAYMHWRFGWDLNDAPGHSLKRAAVISFIAWIVTLVLGRFIAFVGT